MLPFLGDTFGNPSRSHPFGEQTSRGVEEARQSLAGFLSCGWDEIVFTGGGSESDNHAIKGVAHTCRGKGDHIITSQIEHPAVLNTCRFLEKNGFKVSYIPVDRYSMVDVDNIRKSITSKTILITIMHANNETGTIQPVEEIATLPRERGIIVHTDAAQTIGKIPVRTEELGVELLTVAGHKFYAPKGVGALYIRRGLKIEPLIHGAGHERGNRAGTENTAGIVGLGKAAEIADKTMEETARKVLALRQRLHSRITEKIEYVRLNGHPEKRLPNTLNISFRNVDASSLLNKLKDKIAFSLGATCHDKERSLSPVLKAMGVEEDYGFGAVRLSLGKFNTVEEIDFAVELLTEAVNSLRAAPRR